MPELAAELRNLWIVQCAEQDAQSVSEGLHIRCPHCQNPVELVDDESLSDVTCPSCGSQFSLVDDSPRTFQASSQQTIGHFRLLDKVGVGAFGSVWSARDTELVRLGSRRMHSGRPQGVGMRPRTRSVEVKECETQGRP